MDTVTLAPAADNIVYCTPSFASSHVLGLLLMGIVFGAFIALGPYITEDKIVKWSSYITTGLFSLCALALGIYGRVPDVIIGYLIGASCMMFVIVLKMCLNERTENALNKGLGKTKSLNVRPNDKKDNLPLEELKKSSGIIDAENLAESAFEDKHDNDDFIK